MVTFLVSALCIIIETQSRSAPKIRKQEVELMGITYNVFNMMNMSMRRKVINE